MAEFIDEDLQGSRFLRVDLSGSDLRGVVLQHVKISDAWVVDVDISAHVERLVVNGVDVAGYVEEELDRRRPERALLRSSDPEGLLAALAVIEHISDEALARARALPPAALDESVDGEYSYIETLRHLVFAADRWLSGPVFEDVDPVHRLGIPHDGADEAHLLDVEARPSLDEVLALRRERLDRLGELLRTATDEDLAREVASPNGGTTTVRYCVQVVLREEWAHHEYATRDLAVLEERYSKPGGGS